MVPGAPGRRYATRVGFGSRPSGRGAGGASDHRLARRRSSETTLSDETMCQVSGATMIDHGRVTIGDDGPGRVGALDSCWRHSGLRIYRQRSLLIRRLGWMRMFAHGGQRPGPDTDAIRSATEAG